MGAAWELANSLPGANIVDDRVKWGEDTKLKNQVQLSAYPDCIGGDLKGLRSFVQKQLNGVVGGVHVLPFYPSSADRGFAPLTYKEVRVLYSLTLLARGGQLRSDPDDSRLIKSWATSCFASPLAASCANVAETHRLRSPVSVLHGVPRTCESAVHAVYGSYN